MSYEAIDALTRKTRTRARRLAERENIPLRVAFEVVEGRIPADKAILEHRREQRRWSSEATARNRKLIIAFSVVGTLVAGGVGLARWEQHTSHEPAARPGPIQAPAQPANPAVATRREVVTPEQTTRRMARVRTDDDGRVLEVVGPTPESVLVAYCENGAESFQRRPLELAAGVPRQSGVRLGIFEDSSDFGKVFAIRIRNDRARGVWAAGNAKTPATPFAVDPAQIGEPRTPIRLSGN